MLGDTRGIVQGVLVPHHLPTFINRVGTFDVASEREPTLEGDNFVCKGAAAAQPVQKWLLVQQIEGASGGGLEEDRRRTGGGPEEDREGACRVQEKVVWPGQGNVIG